MPATGAGAVLLELELIEEDAAELAALLDAALEEEDFDDAAVLEAAALDACDALEVLLVALLVVLDVAELKLDDELLELVELVGVLLFSDDELLDVLLNEVFVLDVLLLDVGFVPDAGELSPPPPQATTKKANKPLNKLSLIRITSYPCVFDMGF